LLLQAHTLNLLLLGTIQCSEQLVRLVFEVLVKAPECSAQHVIITINQAVISYIHIHLLTKLTGAT